jgi:hypothetical protein
MHALRQSRCRPGRSSSEPTGSPPARKARTQDQKGIEVENQRPYLQDLRIMEITDSSMLSEFWGVASEAMANFTVDLRTGTHEGGVGG